MKTLINVAVFILFIMTTSVSSFQGMLVCVNHQILQLQLHMKTFDRWSMGDNSQYFVEKNVWWYIWSLLNNQPVPLLHWGKCEKANIKYAKNFMEESKDKRTNDQFEDTTENNVYTLSYYHHHQNWAYICHTYWRKKDHVGKKNSKSPKSNMFHMEHKLMTNIVSIELPSIWY